MSNTVAGRTRLPSQAQAAAAGALYTPQGARKYLTRDERQRLLAASQPGPANTDLLILTLAWTGARVSEVLALTPQAFQLDANIVAIRTLKRRRTVIREVPIPAELMATLKARFGLAATQRDEAGQRRRLWPCCRTTAWRHSGPPWQRLASSAARLARVA